MEVQTTVPVKSTLCPSCNNIVLEGYKFCYICGEKINPALFINRVCSGNKDNGQKCNTVLNLGSRFCQSCGTPQDTSNTCSKFIELHWFWGQHLIKINQTIINKIKNVFLLFFLCKYTCVLLIFWTTIYPMNYFFPEYLYWELFAFRSNWKLKCYIVHLCLIFEMCYFDEVSPLHFFLCFISFWYYSFSFISGNFNLPGDAPLKLSLQISHQKEDNLERTIPVVQEEHVSSGSSSPDLWEVPTITLDSKDNKTESVKG